jgi:nicotinamidase-related amidase
MPSVPSAPIDPSSSSLVLVDFFNGLLGVEMHPYTGAQVLDNAVLLADAFREKGALTVLTVGATNPPVGGSYDAAPPTSVFERDMSPLAGVAKVPDWQSFPEKLGPKPGDHVLRKFTWSAFFGTDLDFQLRRRGVRTVVLGGIATNFGAEGTGRDARALGYSVVFVEDAMRAITEEEHRHSVRYTMPMIGRVRSTQEILDGLAAS